MAPRRTLPVVIVAALMAGCGSSGSASKSRSAADSFKQDFIRQVGPLRAVGGELTTALQSAPAQSDAQVHSTFAQLARSTGPVVQGLAGLRPPAGYRADVTTMHDALARAQTDLAAIARAAGHHRAAAAKAAFQRLVADSKVVKAADDRVSQALGVGG